ncbi:Trans-O-hydroxybenzylidenepyruvate hydratase-aldolase [bacterium HR27]|nr:Trans-O-hydroxybenzylidenepyruvate hydratase-aldolase [bacterium HR27]
MIRYQDIRGVIALCPTPAKQGADRWDSHDTVDVDETERMIRNLLASGIDGIVLLGTLGEMATLTESEWRTFAQVAVETVQAFDPDFPLFIGATTLNTRDTIARIRFLEALQVKGVFLGRPMWCAMDEHSIITFYKTIADTFPNISIMLYDNPEAFKGVIPTAVYAELAKIPQIVACKYVSLTPKFRADMEVTRGHIRILPLESDWLQAWILYPDDVIACWSSSALCGPEPVLFLRDALRRGDLEAARWISRRIEWAYEPFLARQNFQEFSKYNIALEKIRFDEAGFVHAGPARPPYHIVPPQYVAGAREHARRWLQLVAAVRERTTI